MTFTVQDRKKQRGALAVPSSRILAMALAGAIFAPAAASAQPIELGPLRVEDMNTMAPLSRETGLATLPGTIQETPQAIIVIPQEQLRQQGVTSLEQALRNVPGITVAIGEGGTLNGDQFKIRGFDAKDDVYVDGLRDFGVYTRDSFSFEEVQILKGPSGAMFGRGTTGGVINTVSKTPFLGNMYSGDGYVGNGDYYRGLFDVNRQIDDTTAIRVNLMGSSNHVVDRDFVKSERWGATAAVAFGLGTDTRFILNYLHQDDYRIPDYGVTIVQRPGSIVAEPATENGVPRNTFLQFPSIDKDKTHADVLTQRLSHRAAPWLTLTSDSRAGFYNRYFAYTTADRCDQTAATAFCATKFFSATPSAANAGIGGSGPYDQRSWGIQNISTARANFDLGMFRTEAIAGFDLSYQDSKRELYYYTLPPTTAFTYTAGPGAVNRQQIGRNLLNPDHNTPPNYAPFRPGTTLNCTTNPCTLNGFTTTATPTSATRTAADSSDFGFFLTDRLWFTDEISVIGGIRYDKFSSEFLSTPITGASALVKSASNLYSPRASLVWEPDPTKTFYFSWGRSATPQGASAIGLPTAISATTADLKPEISENFELGAKYGFFDGRLSATISLFDVTKDNATQTDPATGFIQAQSGEKQNVRGVELGLTGKITPEWTVNANYTFLDSETLSAFSTCAALTATSTTGVACPAGVPVGTAVANLAIIGRQVIFIPKNAATLWTSYNADAFAPGLSFGGGVTYQSKMPVRYGVLSPIGAPAVNNLAQIPDSVTVDAYVAYTVGAYRFALNIYNLTDRLNYAQVFGNRGTPAPGRQFIFSAGFTF